MKFIDHALLQPLSANTPKNKGENAADNQACMSEMNTFLSNFQECLTNMSVYDCASMLISENNWFYKKKSRKCNTRSSNLVLLPRQLVRVDYGKQYEGECGYIHYGLILKILHKEKVQIIPMTTDDDTFDDAFHPIQNPTGKFYMRRALLSEGFSKDATLLMDDMCSISISRIIKEQNTTLINESAFDNIREHIMRMYFSDYFQKAVAVENKAV